MRGGTTWIPRCLVFQFLLLCVLAVTVWGPEICYLSIIQEVTNYSLCQKYSIVCDGRSRCPGEKLV